MCLREYWELGKLWQLEEDPKRRGTGILRKLLSLCTCIRADSARPTSCGAISDLYPFSSIYRVGVGKPILPLSSGVLKPLYASSSFQSLCGFGSGQENLSVAQWFPKQFLP